MAPIAAPRHSPEHTEHIVECEEAIESAVAEVEFAAEEAGWNPNVIACALMNIGKNQIIAIRDTRRRSRRLQGKIAKRRQ